MSRALSKLYLDDCAFINKLVSKLVIIITNCGGIQPPPSQGKTVKGKALEYDTVAVATDVYTLTLEGYIQYIYYQAYQSYYPEAPTDIEKDKIYEIYDALGISRPVL